MGQPSKINIKGIPKNVLLKELWTFGKWASFFSRNPDIPKPDYIDLPADFNPGYMEYYEGKYIKCDISGDMVCPGAYDYIVGDYAFKFIVDKLREEYPLE